MLGIKMALVEFLRIVIIWKFKMIRLNNCKLDGHDKT